MPTWSRRSIEGTSRLSGQRIQPHSTSRR